jgi:hypothetical protein
MSDLMRGAATLIGAFLVFGLCWVLVGFSFRVVQTLFCLGYGC